MKTEKEWRVEDDMRTLVEAERIKKDRKRFKAAVECAERKAKEMAELKRSKK